MAVVEQIQRYYAYEPDAAHLESGGLLGGEIRRIGPIPARWRGVVTLAVIIGSDILAFVICLAFAAYKVAGTDSRGWVGMLAGGACVGCLIAAFLAFRGHYDRRLPAGREGKDAFLAGGLGLVGGAALAFAVHLPVPRGVVLAAALALPPALMVLRRVSRRVLNAAGLWRRRVVVVGSGAWATRAANAIRTDACLGYDVVGQIGVPSRTDVASTGLWSGMMRRYAAEMLVVACSDECRLPSTLVASLVRERVPFSILTEPDGLPVAGAVMARLGGDGLIVSYRNNLRRPLARTVKTAFDLASAVCALIVLAPVFALIAILVSRDGGPVLFAHKRVGARGRVFGCLKFRSMVVESDAALRDHLASDPEAAEEWARTHKLRQDPRVTWIGQILRKTSLDELPQLLNVLALDMSLVGPRPIVSLEIGKYAEDIAYYYESRPGITGLWQVSGRSDTTYQHRVQLDSWYVKNWSVWLDLTILARTIPAVVSGRGAG